MKDNGNEVFEGDGLSKLNNVLKENEKIELPEKLEAKSIEELVSGVPQNEYRQKDKPQKNKNKNKRLALRVLAGAAAFAVAFTSVAIIKPWKKPVKPALTVGEQLDSKNAEDYAEVEKLFCGYAANYKKYNNSLLRGFNIGTLTKSSDNSGEPENTNGGNTAYASNDSFGKTNEQVFGVSEADVWKNDGKYIYAVNSDYVWRGRTYDISDEKVENTKKTSCAVSIIEAGNEGKLTVLGQACADFSGDESILSASAAEIYVEGDRLYMIAALEEKSNDEDEPVDESDVARNVVKCGVRDTKSRTAAVCFDISDKKSPKEMWRVFQEGDYISSRMTDNKLVLISNRFVNIDATQAQLKDDCIPKATLSDGSYGKIGANDICVMEKICDASYVIVSLTNVNEGEKSFKVKAVLGGGNNVYCTNDTLYVTNSVWSNDGAEPYDIVEEVFNVSSDDASCTQIYKFDISDKIKYLGSTAVKGTALNQFSIDEYKGCLRIATTSGSWGDSLENYVTVIDGELKTVGFIDKIAKGETIKSVRFMGDTAYVVTFEQTDPLFVIDLKDPASPVIKSELKIPGFSSYLHPVGDGLLLGIGVDGDENGENGGMKLSLFDVSDPENPKEISKYVIEGEEKSYRDGSYFSTYVSSDAFYDHKAICFDKSSGVVYVPYSKFERSYDSNSDSDYFSITTGAISVKVNAAEKKLEFLNDYSKKSDDDNILIGHATYIGNTVYTFDSEFGIVYSYDKNSATQLSECAIGADK